MVYVKVLVVGTEATVVVWLGVRVPPLVVVQGDALPALHSTLAMVTGAPGTRPAVLATVAVKVLLPSGMLKAVILPPSAVFSVPVNVNVDEVTPVTVCAALGLRVLAPVITQGVGPTGSHSSPEIVAVLLTARPLVEPTVAV